MPSFSTKVTQFYKNIYVRTIALIVTGVALALAVMLPKPPAALRMHVPVVHSQDISRITELAVNKDKLEYLLLANPLSDSPRYVFKYKDAPELHVVKVPSTSHVNLER